MWVRVRSRGPVILNTRNGTLYLYPNSRAQLDEGLLREPEVARAFEKRLLIQLSEKPTDRPGRIRSSEGYCFHLRKVSLGRVEVLIIRSGGLGDLLQLRSSLHALRSFFGPHTKITLATNLNFGHVMENDVDELVPIVDYKNYSRGEWGYTAGGRIFDALFDLEMAVECSNFFSKMHRIDLFGEFVNMKLKDRDPELELRAEEHDFAREVLR